MFKDDHKYSGRLSLEVLDKGAFDKIKFSDSKPMFKTILERSKFSDFTIISDDGTRFPCHKAFLAGEYYIQACFKGLKLAKSYLNSTPY